MREKYSNGSDRFRLIDGKGIFSKILLTLITVLIVSTAFVPGKKSSAAVKEDYKAVWFSYYDYEGYLKKYKNSNNKNNFSKFFTEVVENCEKKGFNTIIAHVRPFADAIYQSDLFPTSKCITGEQGKKLSYDPLKIMVDIAHGHGMNIEAWLNPYRVSFSTNYKELSKNNIARKWHESKKKSERRNVLSYGGKLYFNPASKQVRDYVVKGVGEIVKNYDVDGIHFDDYFYPTFSSSNYKKVFDATEYNKSEEKKNGKSIQYYRKRQVNLLIRAVYKKVKSIRETCTFGISPAGNIDNLKSKYAYYVDIERWTNNTNYVDYIMPQIYWGFNHATAKFDKVFDRWQDMVDQSKVKLYVGLPAYKMGHPEAGTTTKEKTEFTKKKTLLNMYKYVWESKGDGVAVFDYEDITRSINSKLPDCNSSFIFGENVIQ